MKRFVMIVALCILFVAALRAQEGMWLLNQIDKLDLPKHGLQMALSGVYSPTKPSLYNAVVQIGGGTGSFVSREGLILTNHHVAFTALQRSSSQNANYLTEGFLARSRSEEIKAPGYRAQLVLEMKDVTSEILASAKGITDPAERSKKIEVKIAGLTEEIEKGKDDINATVSEMYNGKQYLLSVYKVLKDIRIVYSPPLSIGKYGGEIDNWMWPRHTGDFSFLRAYVSPDGTGKEYSADNVPYTPKVWLKVAKTPLKEGDFTFVIGFPGSTARYRDVNSANWNYTVNYPVAIKDFSETIAILDAKTKEDPAGALKVASLRSGLANVMKNYEGKLAGMKKTGFVQKKRDFEQTFKTWIDADPARKAKYGDIFEGNARLYAALALTKDRDNVFNTFQGLGGTLLGVAIQMYGIGKELDKPEAERQPGFSERAVKEAADRLQYAYADYYEPVDRALTERVLRNVKSLPAGQRIDGLDYIVADTSKSIEQFVDEAYRTSRLKELDYVRTLYGKPAKELDGIKDPFLTMAARLYPLGKTIQEEGRKFAATVGELRKRYIDGLYEWKGSNLYPDANGTMRFTWGPVRGYRPADAVWYTPVTTLRGVVEKNTGVAPFDAPAGLVDLSTTKEYGRWMDPLLKDVPVAFTHQVDITGGNSGSPVMNARGELIGVVFDGNYEAMISDWQYDAELQRSISVDVRYVLFVTEKYSKASFILDEMGLAR